MALMLFGGAVLGAVVSELLKVVVEEAKQTARFKTLLNRLQTTLNDIEPVFKEIDKLNKVLDRPQEETEKFIHYLEYGKKLVLDCSRIKYWEVRKKFVHKNKLIWLDDELLRFFQIETQANLVCTSMKGLIGIYDLNDKMDRLVLSASRAGGFLGSCSVPGLPGIIIGLDRHVAESKRILLKDDTQILVISAPGGCGKTTLAKKLCHDDEIKEIFGDNILYVTVSRTSSLKIIAQKLFEHHGKDHYEFQTDEDAKNQIENLLLQMGSVEMLLVLDDVWSESESLIRDLKFQIDGYKILVTSRFLFPGFKSTYVLSMLNVEDAKTLFRYHAFPKDKIPNNVSDDLVNKMVKFCKGLPLALTVVGASLCGQPLLKWRITLKKLSDGESVLGSNSRLLLSLQTSIDALDESSILRECFFDLGSFPEDDRISGTALMDMWVELYNLDDEGMYASEYLLELSLRNLVNLIPIRKDAGEIEGYCSEHYVTQHDLLRELAIHMSCQDPVVERKRLFMEIRGNDFPAWWAQRTEQPISARVLSISTDESFISAWYDLNAPNVEVLILNIRSNNYALPQFITRMSKLKVLIVTGYGVYPTQLENVSFLSYLSNLKRIRFECVSFAASIQVIFALQNLKKLAFITCKIGNALQNGGIFESPYMLPNLTDLEIDGCYDLNKLPPELFRLVRLQKLSIINCQELDFLPRELGSLSNLQTFGLHGCTILQELPDTIGSMHNLGLLDISDCLSINVLPEQICELSSLRVINMSGCRGLQELPVTMSKMSQLEDVICDEETSYLWKNFGSDQLCNVKINLVEEDRSGSFMKIYR